MAQEVAPIAASLECMEYLGDTILDVATIQAWIDKELTSVGKTLCATVLYKPYVSVPVWKYIVRCSQKTKDDTTITKESVETLKPMLPNNHTGARDHSVRYWSMS